MKKNTILNLSRVSNYYNLYKGDHFLNDDIVNDLNIDDLFLKINCTSSKVGQQYLYHQLRVCNNSVEKINNFRDKLNHFNLKLNEENKLQLKLFLEKINHEIDYEIILSFESETKKNNKRAYLKFYLTFVFLIYFAFIINPTIWFLSTLIISFIVNFIIYFRFKIDKTYFFIVFNRIYNLINVCKIIQNYLRKNNFDMEQKINYINIKKKFTFFSFFNKTNPITQDPFALLFYLIIQILKVITLVEILWFDKFENNMKLIKDDLLKIYKYIGEIDTLLSVNEFRNKQPFFCEPNFIISEKNILNVEEIYHPLLDNFVSNNFNLKNNCIITGSNMSGKSTFIKTIAINAILANSIYTCCAKKYETSFFDVLTSVNLKDNLFDNTSFYLQEIIKLKEIINISTNNIRKKIIIIDEILKGTNHYDRILISKSILNYLSLNKNNIIFVTTHDLDLVVLLNKTFDKYYFEETFIENNLLFDYKIKQGISNSKNAIKLLKYIDFPIEIINDINVSSEK